MRRHLRPPPDFVACASRGSNERVSTAHSVGQESVATATATAIATATTTVSAPASGVRAATIAATVARTEVTSTIVA